MSPVLTILSEVNGTKAFINKEVKIWIINIFEMMPEKDFVFSEKSYFINQNSILWFDTWITDDRIFIHKLLLKIF